jgi:tetratricopeptide (TPR) repeat protein
MTTSPRCYDCADMHRLVRHLVAVLLLGAALPATAQPRSAAAVAREGWTALKAGQLQEAAVAFDEALRSEPASPDFLLGSALAAHLLGRYEDARRHLLGALAVDPDFKPASVLLGDVLYRMGDVQSAIEVYSRMLALAPDEVQLAGKVAAWEKEFALHNRFERRLGNHFTVLFEGPAEAELAVRAVDILEAASWRIGGTLFTYPAEPITVVLYTRQQFRDVTQSPEWAGGAFSDGRIRIPVQGALEHPGEFARVLTHEFTHALVHSVAPRGVPFWLNEGLAVYFEDNDTSEPRRLMERKARRLPLGRLERSFRELSSEDAELAYAQSALAVEALIEQNGAQAVVHLLADIGRGVPFADAFARHMLMSYQEFQSAH